MPPVPPPRQPPDGTPPGLTTTEAATLAGVTPTTIRAWIHRRHLTTQPDGTLQPADVWRCARDRRPRTETARLTLAATLAHREHPPDPPGEPPEATAG